MTRPSPRMKKKRMVGIFNHLGELTEVHPSEGQAELAQQSFIDVTWLLPVLVTWTLPRKRKGKGK